MKTMTLLPVLLALSSCVVESPVPVRRSAEVLLDYTVSGLVPMALTEPVAAVRSLSSQDGQVDRNGIVWNVECIEEGKWRLDFSAGYEKNASADVLVEYAGGEPEAYKVVSEGNRTEYGYSAAFRTGETGVTVEYVPGAAGESGSLVPVSGCIYTDFLHDGQTLDYCNLEFSQGGFTSDISAD